MAPLPAWAQNQTPPSDDTPASSQPAPPEQQEQQDQQDQQDQQASPALPAQSARPLPATLTLPAGALVAVRTSQWLSSDRNHVGDTFSAVLDQPLVVNGWVVARRGQTVIGRVDVAQKASAGNGVSRLGLEITELTLVDGTQVPVSTQMQQAVPTPAVPGSAERDVATVGTTTVLGTIVGAAVGGGQGAAIGAGLGATAGLAAVLYTRGRPTVVGPEALLNFRLAAPLEISTEQGAVAFQPVTQADYQDQDAYANGRRRRGAGPAYPPPYYYYGYCGLWGWSCYPGPYFGPYVGWGVWVGPRFRGFGRFR
ncbi:MAG TPA: hypothetical protein VJN43_05970 [Bryobacteraceae bacterium]|nr:hypothetical protein [Bryobacteraceae bacterium]